MLFLVFVILSLCCTTSSQSIRTEKNIDEYLAHQVNVSNLSGFSIAIFDKKHTKLNYQYGSIADASTPIPLGSLSKSFAAVAIMQLVEEHKIKLSDPIDKFLNNKELIGKNITIQDLLNHTSGLATISNSRKNISFLSNRDFEYSNANYNILGYIIEQITGLTYEEYVKNYIFLPLRMKNSYLDIDKAKENGLAPGYRSFFGFNIEYNNASWDENSWIQSPSGYTIVSTNDMVRYLQTHLNNGLLNNTPLLSERSIYDILNKGPNVSGSPATSGFFTDEAKYGFGWISKKIDDTKIYYHTGKLPHYTTMMVLIPELDTGFIILSNNGDFLVSTSMIEQTGIGVTSYLLGRSVSSSSINEYWIKHIWLNTLLLLITVCTLYLFWSNAKLNIAETKNSVTTFLFILLLFAVPTCTLTLLPIITSTPLLEIIKFVPDVLIIILLNTVLLFLLGIIKVTKCFFYHNSGKS